MLARAIPALLGKKKVTEKSVTYQKTYLHYITFNEKRQEYNMTYLIIATIILALTEIIVLPFASKRLSIFDWEDVEDETI